MGHTEREGAANTEQEYDFVRTAKRPITLVGYGMGARVIFNCLEHLAKLSKAQRLGDHIKYVENVVIIGAPIGLPVSKYVSSSWQEGCNFRFVLLILPCFLGPLPNYDLIIVSPSSQNSVIH